MHQCTFICILLTLIRNLDYVTSNDSIMADNELESKRKEAVLA